MLSLIENWITLKLITTKGSYNNLNAKNKDYDTLVSFTKN